MPLRPVLLSALLPALLAPAALHAETIQITGGLSDRAANDEAYPYGNLIVTFDVDPATLPLPRPPLDDPYETYSTDLSNVRIEVDFTTPPYDGTAHPIPTIIETGGTGYITTGGYLNNELGFHAGQLSGSVFPGFGYTGNGDVFNDDGFTTAILQLDPGPQSILPYTEYYDIGVTGSTILSADTPEPSSLLLLGTGALASASTLQRRRRKQSA